MSEKGNNRTLYIILSIGGALILFSIISNYFHNEKIDNRLTKLEGKTNEIYKQLEIDSLKKIIEKLSIANLVLINENQRLTDLTSTLILKVDSFNKVCEFLKTENTDLFKKLNQTKGLLTESNNKIELLSQQIDGLNTKLKNSPNDETSEIQKKYDELQKQLTDAQNNKNLAQQQIMDLSYTISNVEISYSVNGIDFQKLKYGIPQKLSKIKKVKISVYTPIKNETPFKITIKIYENSNSTPKSNEISISNGYGEYLFKDENMKLEKSYRIEAYKIGETTPLFDKLEIQFKTGVFSWIK